MARATDLLARLAGAMRLAAGRKSRSLRAAVMTGGCRAVIGAVLTAAALSGCASHADGADQPVSLAGGRVTVASPAGPARVSGRESPAHLADHPWLRQLAASEKIMVTGRLAKAGMTVTFHLRSRALAAGTIPVPGPPGSADRPLDPAPQPLSPASWHHHRADHAPGDRSAAGLVPVRPDRSGEGCRAGHVRVRRHRRLPGMQHL